MVEPPPRIAAVIRHVAWVGIAAHAGFVPLFALLGHPRLAAFNVLSVAAWIAAAIVNRRGRSTTGMWLLTIEVVAHAVLAVMTLGWASGFQYYLLPLIPFVMFNDRLGSRAVIGISAGVFAALILLRAVAPDGGVEGAVAPIMRYGNLAIPVLALALVSYHFRRASTQAERRMESMATPTRSPACSTGARWSSACERPPRDFSAPAARSVSSWPTSITSSASTTTTATRPATACCGRWRRC